MNLLYLHAHDLGRWLSPYGRAAATPALAEWASRPGTRVFRQAHSAAPTCSPSRAALLTGQFPHETGMLGLMHRGFRLRRPGAHLAAVLGGQGYETVLAGIQHLEPSAELTGYDRRLNPVSPLTQPGRIEWPAWDREVARRAAGFLAERGPGGRPFFLDCGFWQPHRPFPPESVDPDGVAPPPGVADTAATRRDMARFLTAVNGLDACCGEVLGALDAAGLADETLAIFTTDHGPAFPGYKCRLTDGGTGVALMIRPPASTPPGPGCLDDLVSQVDLFPTILDYLGLDPPPWTLRGRSLRPVMEGRREGGVTGDRPVFAEVTYHAAYEPMRAVRTDRYVWIRRFEEDPRPVPANVDDSPAKEAWLAAGGIDRPQAAGELYDRWLDPMETRNLADDPAFGAVRAGLEARLRQWMEETGDPLLEGAVPLPPGGYANAREHLSATVGESRPRAAKGLP